MPFQKPLNKASIWDQLRRFYPENQYALLSEVRNDAGFNASNAADYIAIGLWPSRGLDIIGIELKMFRSDWLRELKKPEKAEPIFKYCDYFFLLCGDENIARKEEIPENWGYLYSKGNKIKVGKAAPMLYPSHIEKGFLA